LEPKKGDIAGGVDAINGAIDRVKEPTDPKPARFRRCRPARGMANFGTKMQQWVHDYGMQPNRLKKRISQRRYSRSRTIEEDRQIARDFIAANASFWMWRLQRRGNNPCRT